MTIRVIFSCLILAVSAMALAPSAAEAAVCAKGVNRAGCAGPNGAVVARKPVAAATTCRFVNGVRVCKRYW